MVAGAVKRQEHDVTAVAPSPASAPAPVSHNLNGQKLGRKGRLTRERILAVTAELLAESDEPISLSAVARRASLGMTSLYNYFADLTELLIAVLEPVMMTARDGYAALLRERWSDAEVGERCLTFVQTYYTFWQQHSRLLHLRNSMADGGDRRMLVHRVLSTQPLIGWLAEQMDGNAAETASATYAMATVVMTGIERTVTVVTDNQFTHLFGDEVAIRNHPDHYLGPEARLMELAIRDMREKARG